MSTGEKGEMAEIYGMRDWTVVHGRGREGEGGGRERREKRRRSPIVERGGRAQQDKQAAQGAGHI
jgi:hypothetical protein